MLENLPNHIFSSINEFQILEEEKPLGRGSFGVVRKAKHRMSNRQYAIKIITLDSNITEVELLLLSRQISIHYSLDHPHIIKLWAVLSAGNKIYMVMDCAENGNLFKLLVKKKGLSEQEAFRYFYQVTDALEYMHKRNVFHRDIKPENILLDANMNAKICDFGWVADQIHRKRSTFCGTYEYMSPETVNEQKYDYKIDIWALGVLLFQMIHCKPPFPAKDIEELKKSFAKGLYQIKENISPEYKRLMVSLLQFQPNKRIEIHLIKKSPWAIKWSSSQNERFYRSSHKARLSSGIEFSTNAPSSCLLKQSKSGILGKTNTSHKKYKTLQQEDFYCLKDSQGVSRVKYKTPRFNQRDQSQNQEYMLCDKKKLKQGEQNQKKPYKRGINLRSHLRKDSEDLLLQNFGKGVRYQNRFMRKQSKRKKINSHTK